jgi:hypothetical protein
MIQPSALRITNPRAPIPSSKLLGYYHSSALRTDNSTFRAKLVQALACPAVCNLKVELLTKPKPEPAESGVY